MGNSTTIRSIIVTVLTLAASVALVLWRLSLDPWADAADLVRARIAPGELVVLAPQASFVETHRFEGLPAVATSTLALTDARRFPGLWVVAEGAPPKALSRTLSQLGEPTRESVSGLTVLHYPDTGARR